MRNDGWDKGFHQCPRQVALSLPARNGSSSCYFCCPRVTWFPILGDWKSRAVYFPQGKEALQLPQEAQGGAWLTFSRTGAGCRRGDPSGRSWVPMNKAGRLFTLQSLTWDPGFCTQHFLLHTFVHTFLAGWASYSPAPPRGGCVGVRAHKEGGVVCHEQALSRWQLHCVKSDDGKQLGAFSSTNCLSQSEPPGEMQISKPNAWDKESLIGYQMVHMQINAYGSMWDFSLVWRFSHWIGFVSLGSVVGKESYAEFIRPCGMSLQSTQPGMEAVCRFCRVSGAYLLETKVNRFFCWWCCIMCYFINL